MKRTVTCVLLAAVVTLLFSHLAAAEYSGPYYYTVDFGSTGPGAGSIYEKSPARQQGNSSVEVFPQVNSKFNQPRNEGTNPH